MPSHYFPHSSSSSLSSVRQSHQHKVSGITRLRPGLPPRLGPWNHLLVNTMGGVIKAVVAKINWLEIFDGFFFFLFSGTSKLFPVGFSACRGRIGGLPGGASFCSDILSVQPQYFSGHCWGSWSYLGWLGARVVRIALLLWPATWCRALFSWVEYYWVEVRSKAWWLINGPEKQQRVGLGWLID